MITVASQPPAIAEDELSINDPKQPPVPVSDCIQWCLQADDADVITTAGSKATVTIFIPTTCTVPANGTALKVWNYDFTVQSTPDFSAQSFKANAIGIFTALNLANMFSANLFFNRAVTITSASVTGGINLVLTWKECREQPRFAAEHFDFTAITALGGTGAYSNGVSPEYVEGYKMGLAVGVWQDATSEFDKITVIEAVEVDKLCDTTGEVCVNYQEDIQSVLYTPLPEMTPTGRIEAIENGRTMMRLFSLEYGWTYREGGVAKSGTFKKSDRVLVLNAAPDVMLNGGLARYWYDHPDGHPDGLSYVDFLTLQPKGGIPLCRTSYKWLWFLNNWQAEYGTYKLRAIFALYNSAGGLISSHRVTINDPAINGSAWFQPVCFNVSPEYIETTFSLSMANVARYEVQVHGTNPADVNDVWFNATEYLSFYLDRDACCGEDYHDVYFLSSASGIDTIRLRLDEVASVQEGTAVRLLTDCSADRETKARYGGQTMQNIRSYKRLRFTAGAEYADDLQRWWNDFRKSPQRWVRLEDTSGDWIARKLLFDNSETIIKRNAEGVELEFSAYLPDDPTQKANEP